MPRRLNAWLARGWTQGTFLRAAGAVSLLRLAGGLLLFTTQVLLASWMGAEFFGLYSYAWAWVAVIATIAGLGFGSTSVRFLASYRVEQSDARIRGLVRFGRVMTLSVGTAAAVVSIVLASILAADSAYLNSLRIALVAVPVLAFLQLEAAYARAFNWMTLSIIAEQIGRPVWLIILGSALYGMGYKATAEAYVVACLLAYVLATAAQHVVLDRHIQRVTGTGPGERESALWMRVSVALLIISGAQMIRMNTDLLLVGTLLDPAQLGIYTAAVRTATLVSFVLAIGSVVAQPQLSALHARRNPTELRNYLAATTRWIFLASLLAGIVVVVFGAWTLELFGRDFTSGYPSLVILTAGHVLVAVLGPLTSYLMMTGRQDAAAVVHVASAAANIVLNLGLIPRFGIVGAAIASSLILVITQLVLWVLARRALDAMAESKHEVS